MSTLPVWACLETASCSFIQSICGLDHEHHGTRTQESKDTNNPLHWTQNDKHFSVVAWLHSQCRICTVSISLHTWVKSYWAHRCKWALTPGLSKYTESLSSDANDSVMKCVFSPLSSLLTQSIQNIQVAASVDRKFRRLNLCQLSLINVSLRKLTTGQKLFLFFFNLGAQVPIKKQTGAWSPGFVCVILTWFVCLVCSYVVFDSSLF